MVKRERTTLFGVKMTICRGGIGKYRLRKDLTLPTVPFTIQLLVISRGEMEMAVIKRKTRYFVEYQFEGKRFREKIGNSKTLAKKVLNKIKFEIAESRKNASVSKG